MTKRERSSRAERLSLERSPDVLLDSLLEGGPLPDDAPARWQPVTEVLTALTSAPGSRELSGETRALAQFRTRPRPVPRPGPAHRLRPGWVTWRHGPRPAVAAAAGAVLMGGLLAVAYAGDLPAAAQRLAHDTIDAPAAVRAGFAVPAPAGSARPASRLPTAAGGASSPSGHGSAQPDRRMSHGPPSGSPHDRHWRSSSAPRTPGGTSGRQEQGISGQPASPGQGSPGQGSPSQGNPGQGGPGQGNPGGSPASAPTQQPAPSASTAPSAGGTQSPSP